MRHYPLIPTFFLSFVYMLFIPLFLPKWPIFFFAPLLVFALIQVEFAKLLLLAFIAGLLQDLFTSSTPFGFYALIYAITAICIQRCKHTFFKDETVTWILLFLFVAAIQALLEFVLGLIFKLPAQISWRFTLFPLLSLIYAWIGFLIPFYLVRVFYRKQPTQ